MASRNLPATTNEDIQGRTGVHLVGLKVHQDLEWIFREKPTSDIGIDGEIELRSPSGESHGRIIAVQIKCGPSYLREQTSDSIVYRGDYKHLRYWSNYAVPVIVILCDPSTCICWWQVVDMQKIRFNEKGWVLEVEKKNVLGKPSSDALTTVAARLQKKDIIELALRDWVGWRFEHQMRLVSLFASPRDYHWFSHLGNIGDEFYMIDYVLADVRGFQLDAVEEFLKAARGNYSAYNYKHVLLAFVSESMHHLLSIPDPPTLLGMRIEYVPLLLQLDGEPRLSELGKDSKLVAFYENGETIGDFADDVVPVRKYSEGRTLA